MAGRAGGAGGSSRGAGREGAGEVPPHPSMATATMIIALGGAGFALVLAAAVGGGGSLPSPTVPFAAVIAALFVALGAYIRASAPAVQRLNLALGAIERGEIERAEALLDGISRHAPAYPKQVALLQRALIAFQRADVDAMRARLAELRALPVPVVGRSMARSTRLSARALEALGLALAGDAAGAREAVREVRADDDSYCDALATASVAEALCLRREGRADELAAQLRRDRDLVGEHGRVRERALARALGRAAAQAGNTPYRERGDERPRGASLGAWAERLVPGLGAFVAGPAHAGEGADVGGPGGEHASPVDNVRATRGESAAAAMRAAEGPPPAPGSPGEQSPAAGRDRRASGQRRGLGLMLAVVLAGVALAAIGPGLLSPSGPNDAERTFLVTLLPVAAIALGLRWAAGRQKAAAPGALGGRAVGRAASSFPWHQRVLLSWVLLILCFVGIWRFVAPEPARVTAGARRRDVAALSPAPPARADRAERDEDFDDAREADDAPEVWPENAPAGRHPPRADGAGEGQGSPSAGSAATATWTPVLFLALPAFWFFVQLSKSAKTRRACLRAQRNLALGRDVAAARASLEALARSPRPLDAASARLELARLAARGGDFEAARGHAESALATALGDRAARQGGHDGVVPELRGLLAYALAALDDAAGAEAELGALRADHPAYPGYDRVAQQVRLLVALRRGRLGEAARLAAARSPDLSMPWRDELLGELSIAVAEPSAVGRPAFERLGSEVRGDPPLSRWLDRAAPALMNEFRRVDAGRAARAV